MGHACIAFQMDDAREAWEHICRNAVRVIDYGDCFEGNFLYTWDDGSRVLRRCRVCGGYILQQNSEFHSTMHEDAYYKDYFPVSGPEEAEEFNRHWDGWDMENAFPGRYLIQDENNPPCWKWGIKPEEAPSKKTVEAPTSEGENTE